jgi:hypothetical protein
MRFAGIIEVEVPAGASQPLMGVEDEAGAIGELPGGVRATAAKLVGIHAVKLHVFFGNKEDEYAMKTKRIVAKLILHCASEGQ